MSEAQLTADMSVDSRDFRRAVGRIERKLRALTRDQRASWYGKNILAGLNFTGRHVYGGTVPYAERRRRRAENRRARQARRRSTR